ncbi:MAG: hypothetical protein DHS20C15_06330 [Planctomycetota bacterium]|nr:MAG: hypothetical protein DHS20C15_06330 [Planctomycetota bacterium]
MPLSPRFQAAVQLTLELHRDQHRKGGELPYVTHLFAVMALVGEAGGTENEQIAALLHDAVEDQGGAPTLARLRAEFGDEVADIVAACSDTDVVPKPPWEARKRAYIEHLRTASRSVLLVSAADKLHNLRSTVFDARELGAEIFARFNGGHAGTLWYYRGLLAIFEERLGGPLVEELSEALARLETLTGPTPES